MGNQIITKFNLIFKCLLLLPCLFLLFPARTAIAKIIYVPRDYSTIQSAIDAASYGDEIRVFAGTYYENIRLKDGITLKGEDPQTTIIDGQKENDVISISSYSQTRCNIIGFTLTNAGGGVRLLDSGAGISAVLSGSIIGTISNNIIKNNDNGITLGTETNYRVQTNIVNNVFYNNSNRSITSGIVPGYGIDAGDNAPIIFNNIFIKNEYGIDHDSWNKDIISGYNNFYSNPSDFEEEEGTIQGDPLFVDPASNDFHLQSGSPCIDAGNPDSSYNDLDGSRNDMGVYGGPYARVAGNAPYTPNNPSPSNGATGISLSPILSWSGGDPDSGDTVTYDIYFGTASNPPKDLSQRTTSYSPSSLSYSTTYYWKIIARDDFAETEGPVWHFATVSNPNQPPIANAGSDQVVATGSTIKLNATKSYDPDGYFLTWQWTMIDKPQGSDANLSKDTGYFISFTPDIDGIYRFKLIVNDASLDSNPDYITIRALGQKNKIVVAMGDSKYQPDDKLNLCIWVGNSASSSKITSDVFIGFGTPIGSLLFLDSNKTLNISNPSNPKTFTPFVQDLEIPSGFVFPGINEANIDTDDNGKKDGYVLYSFILPHGMAPGEYFAFAAMAEAGPVQNGAPKIIGEISISEFSIGN